MVPIHVRQLLDHLLLSPAIISRASRAPASWATRGTFDASDQARPLTDERPPTTLPRRKYTVITGFSAKWHGGQKAARRWPLKCPSGQVADSNGCEPLTFLTTIYDFSLDANHQ